MNNENKNKIISSMNKIRFLKKSLEDAYKNLGLYIDNCSPGFNIIEFCKLQTSKIKDLLSCESIDNESYIEALKEINLIEAMCDLNFVNKKNLEKMLNVGECKEIYEKSGHHRMILMTYMTTINNLINNTQDE